MKLPLFSSLVLAFGLVAATARADQYVQVVPLGSDTFALTRTAATGFVRDTEKLKAQALEDAAAYCAKMKKEVKVLSAQATRPKVPLTGYATAKVTFKALAANDPELHAPLTAAPIPGAAPATVAAAPVPRTATDTLYNDLLKLDELRKRGILTDEEFQAQKKKLLESH